MQEKGTDRASQRKPRTFSALFLFVVLLLVYNSNFHCIHSGDATPTRLLPFTLLLDHSFYLDRFFPPSLPAWYKPYFARKVNGHWLSAYPVILPVTLVPLYVLPAKLLTGMAPSPLVGYLFARALIDTMEKLSASLIAALSAAVLYMALRKKAAPAVSLTIALIYGLASNTWTISSQALWRHGFTELAFALLLWALLSDFAESRRAFWAGLALALAAANNIAQVAVVLPFILYFFRRSRKEFVSFMIPLSVLGILVLAYNLHYFGRILGGYPNPFPHLLPGHHPPPPRSPEGPVAPSARTPFWVGALGLLVSPNRGLLIYMPWTLIALWGAARIWKENLYGWGRTLIAGMALVYLEHAKLGSWWGGWAFGPRYMTDLLPLFSLFLLPVWDGLHASGVLRAVFVLAVAASLCVQVIGAYYYRTGIWEADPVDVDVAPARLWNWRDTQLRRSLRAGPAPPQVFLDWSLYFKVKAMMSRPNTAPRNPKAR